MRNAHRPKALPSRKLPRGIERQDELIELIEKRFHQEDLIRDALGKMSEKDDISAAENTSSAKETIIEGVPFEQDATTPESAPSAEETVPAEDTADSTPSAEKTPVTAESVTIRWHGQNETIADPRIWLTVFDTVRDAGDAVTREVANRRFHGESYWKTCDALYLSTGTYYHHVRAILHYAFACAVYHRLIDPRPKHFSSKAK